MADASLIFNILGKDRVSDVLRRVKREAATANDDNVKGFKQLDAQIEKTRANVGRLAAEFAKTGSDDTKRDFLRENRTLKGLERLRGEFTKVAEEGAASGGLIAKAWESVSGAVSKNPYIAAGIAAAIVVGAPTIGAAVSAAVLLGVGGGVLAGGIALAVRDARVKAAYAEVGRAALDELSGAAGVFIDPMIRGARHLRDDFDAIMPSIRGSFSTLSPVVERLIAGVGGLARNAMPGVSDAVRAAVPLLDTLAGEMPRIGSAVSQFMSAIARGGPGANQFLQDFLRWLEVTIVYLGYLIEGLAKTYAAFSGLSRIMSGDLTGGMLIWDQFLKKGKDGADGLAGGIDGVGSSAGGVVPSLDTATTAVGHLEGSFRDAIQQAGFFTGTLDKVNGGNIALASSQITAQGAIRQLKDALQESHGSLDISTEKGAAARQAAIGLAQAAGDVAQKTYEQTGSSSQAAAVLGQYRQALINTMVQSGMTSEAAGALADEYLRIPPSLQTTVSAPGLPQTKADAAEHFRNLDAHDGKTINTYVYNNVITRYRQDGVPIAPRGQPQAELALGGIRRAAIGTVMSPRDPGWVLAGEPQTGGEVLTPLRGISQSRAMQLTSVIADAYDFSIAPNGSAGRAAPTRGGGRGGSRGGGGGNTYYITNHVAPGASPADVGAATVESIKAYERLNGASWRSRT